MTYAWDFHFPLNKIAKGDTNALKIDKFYAKNSKLFSKDAYRMLFTSNHDENSWAGSEYERMGDAAQTFAVLCYVFPGMPVIYSGQESKVTRRINFFEKDTINWDTILWQHFTQSSMHLRGIIKHYGMDFRAETSLK